jgi:hypothetical protein
MLFSKMKAIVVFGVADLAILLAVSAVKEYAFTSLGCAYAAIANDHSCLFLEKQRESIVTLWEGPFRVHVRRAPLVPPPIVLGLAQGAISLKAISRESRTCRPAGHGFAPGEAMNKSRAREAGYLRLR